MASKTTKFVATLLIMFLCLSCGSKSFETKGELASYLQEVDNGYHFKKSINGIDFSLTYRPTDLMVSQFMDEKTEPARVEKLRKKYSQYLYFSFGISANGKELLSQKAQNRAEYGAKVNQLAFGMANNVILTDQKRDTLALLDYTFPRTYGMGRSTNLLLVYENDRKAMQQEHLFLTIKDLGYGTGEVSFKIDTKKIKQQPRLKF